MAEDHYGNVVSIGDRVTKVGSSEEFIVSDIDYLSGRELLDLDGPWRETRVRPENIIVK